MSTSIKTAEEIKILREGGRRLAAIRDALAALALAGRTTQELEDASAELFLRSGGEPSFQNYRGRKQEKPYPARTCISVNDAIVHGLPSRDVVFKEGDVVGVDVGLKYKGFYTDTAVTILVTNNQQPTTNNQAARKLLEVTRQALAVGIAAIRASATTGDIGYAIEQFVKAQGNYGIVRTLAGHGVGYAVHEEPHVPNFGRKGEGAVLKAGMVLAIEPMLTLEGEKLVLDPDGFTFRTADGSLTAHFEHTIVVTEHGAEILTA